MFYYLILFFLIAVEEDYYVDLWKCLFFPQIDGKWSSWNDQTISINKQQCSGNLIHSTRKCDSPSPQYCGLTCGEHFIKVDILPGIKSFFRRFIYYFAGKQK